jgi:hypothetical protein
VPRVLLHQGDGVVPKGTRVDSFFFCRGPRDLEDRSANDLYLGWWSGSWRSGCAPIVASSSSAT